MHCPTCNKTLAAGTKCPKCGKMAVASSADEIDLLPLEPARPADPSAFQPPPEAFLPPPPMPGKGAKAVATAPGQEPVMDEPIRPRAGAMAPKAGNTNLIIGGVVVAIVVLFIGWRMVRTENKIILGNGNVPAKPFTIQPNVALVQNLEISGKIPWSFEVTPTEDTVTVGVVQRNPKDPVNIPTLKKLNENYETVKKGETHSMSGEFKTGQYSWVVMNETKKAVRVKVTFKAQPQ